MTTRLFPVATNAPAILLSVLTFVLAVVVMAQADAANSGPMFATGAALGAIALLIPQSLMIAKQYQKAVVLRLGRLAGIRGPGWFVLIPIVDQVTADALWLPTPRTPCSGTGRSRRPPAPS